MTQRLSVPGSMAGAVRGHVLTSASATYRAICAAAASDQPRDPSALIDGSAFASARGTSLPNFSTVGNRTNEVGEEVVSFQVRVCSLLELGRLLGRGESALTPKGCEVVEISCPRGEQLHNEHLLQRCAEHQQVGTLDQHGALFFAERGWNESCGEIIEPSSSEIVAFRHLGDGDPQWILQALDALDIGSRIPEPAPGEQRPTDDDVDVPRSGRGEHAGNLEQHATDVACGERILRHRLWPDPATGCGHR
jgi:hypothetical protein